MKKTADKLAKPEQYAERLRKEKKDGYLAVKMERAYLEKLKKLAKFHGVKPSTLVAELTKDYLDLYA